MRRPTRRAAIALVIAVTVFTAMVAFAASLTVTSGGLQAGAATVGQVCTSVASSYTTAGVDTTTGNPVIQYVSLVPAGCTNGANHTVTVYLEKAGAPYTVLGSMTATGVTIAAGNTFTAVTAGAGAAIIGATTLQFDFASLLVPVTDLSNIAIVIA